jgi:hypothetical protein
MEASNVKQQEQPTATATATATATMTLYVVLENGELYPSLYYSYEAAREAVLDKHAETLDDERSECAEWGGAMCSKVDVEENRESGTTQLYIEKEINITIQRYRGLCPPTQT